MKGKSVESKFEKSSVIRQPNAFKSQRQSVLGVIPTTSVSRPWLKGNRIEDRVMPNNSQGKKQEVEDHHRNFMFSNNKTSVTACNDSLNAKTSNVNFLCVTCGKCVLNENHDMYVLHYINGVNSRTRQPIFVPISTRGPKRNVNQYVATSHKKTVATESTVNKPRSINRMLYEQVSKTCSWWYPKFTPSGYKWKPKSLLGNVNVNLVEIIQFIVNLGCSKHMTRNLKLLSNFVEKFLGTVKFRNDQIAPILGYGDLVQGTITNKRFYYVEGMNHNLLSVGQLCDADLEVAFRKSTCYICDLKGNDLHTGSCGTDLYSITLQKTSTPNLICLMAKATSSQAWLWHRCLSHLNFDSINLLSNNDIVIGIPKLKFVKYHLCSSCELGKAKRKSFHTKTTPSSKRRLQLLHMDLCGPMRVENINGKKYFLVIVDDYSRYTWTHFLRSKDETPNVLFDFLRLVQRGLHAQSSAVNNVDAHDKRQQQNTTQSTTTVVAADLPPLHIQTTHVTSNQAPTQAPTITADKNINQAKTHVENAQVEEDKFIYIFKQVIGNPSQSIRTSRQLETNGEMCMFALTMSQTEPKNIKEAMADSAWIEAMQEEIH
ncbi:retrovirus-related pol polyprotein from transposon TNT 1-94 [Tanacetum coccineum]